MIKVAAFDLDGTIADTIPMCIEAFEQAVSPYAGHTLSQEEIVQTFGLNETGMIKAVVSGGWEEALRDFYRIYARLLAQCGGPFEGIAALIDQLKQRGIAVALITGKGAESCRMTLEHFGLKDVFAEVMTGSEYRNVKADSMLALMNKYHVSADEFVYIGDAVSDVKASREAGVRCLSAAWSGSVDLAGLSEVNAGNVYETISDLARAFEGAALEL